ncbi:MAG: HEAT repeat domain-containing protein [Bacteroidales bacterium]|jgi:hypothetical protein|nr:HEAT repeat domain-containing protein [Bacteroidales bacterium]
MNCKEIIELLPEFIEKSPGKDLPDEVEKHLSRCNACKDELKKLLHIEGLLSQVREEKVPAKVDFAFRIMLENEKNTNNLSFTNRINQKHISLSILTKVAAGILLLISGGFVGYFIHPVENTSIEVSSLKQEMVEMKNLVILSLIKQESPSERIKAVSYIKEISKPDPELIEMLFSTLNSDRNVNVRLAAAQALSKYKDNREIAKGIVKSLETQTEPLVQIMLINLAVETRGDDVTPELNKLLNRSDLMDEVKSFAQKGIKTLSI